MQKPAPNWPDHIEAHRGPGGGAMYWDPGWPGVVYHRYFKDVAVQAHLKAIRDAIESGDTEAAIKMTQFAGLALETGAGPVPEGIYWSGENANFYRQETGKGMGADFFNAWQGRRAEFPSQPS